MMIKNIYENNPKNRSVPKFLFSALVFFLSVLMLRDSFVVRAATETASDLEELAVIVNRHGVKRDKDFSVRYTGPDKDIDYILEDEELSFFYKELALADDPATSDDADYLSANLDFSGNTFELSYEDGIIYFKLDYFETLSQTEKVNKKIPEILSELGIEKMSDYEKVKAIHDYICKLITYKYSQSKLTASMYGALENGRADCNAYSLCIYKLLVEAGVPCKIVGGTAGTGRDSGGHGWNIVKLGDKWYYIDATWDDTDKGKNGMYYEYFLKGSSDFDDADPEQLHNLQEAYTSKEFTKAFPMSKTEYKGDGKDDGDSEKIGANDKNDDLISEKDNYDTEKTNYKWKNIVEYSYPSLSKISVKKGKECDILLSFKEKTGDLVKSVKYNIKSGKNCIKYIKDYGIEKDRYGRFVFLTIKGKKAGKAKIEVVLTLNNGQTITRTFECSVKP